MQQIRSIFNSPDGLNYILKDPEQQLMTRVNLRHDFMSDMITSLKLGDDEGKV